MVFYCMNYNKTDHSPWMSVVVLIDKDYPPLQNEHIFL